MPPSDQLGRIVAAASACSYASRVRLILSPQACIAWAIALISAAHSSLRCATWNAVWKPGVGVKRMLLTSRPTVSALRLRVGCRGRQRGCARCTARRWHGGRLPSRSGSRGAVRRGRGGCLPCWPGRRLIRVPHVSPVRCCGASPRRKLSSSPTAVLRLHAVSHEKVARPPIVVRADEVSRCCGGGHRACGQRDMDFGLRHGAGGWTRCGVRGGHCGASTREACCGAFVVRSAGNRTGDPGPSDVNPLVGNRGIPPPLSQGCLRSPRPPTATNSAAPSAQPSASPSPSSLPWPRRRVRAVVPHPTCRSSSGLPAREQRSSVVGLVVRPLTARPSGAASGRRWWSFPVRRFTAALVAPSPSSSFSRTSTRVREFGRQPQQAGTRVGTSASVAIQASGT